MTAFASAGSTLTLRRAFLGITLGFAFLAILIVLLGGATFQLSRTGTARSAELSERLLPALGELVDLQAATLKYNLANQEFVTARDEATQARKLSIAAQERKSIDLHAAALQLRLDVPDARARLERFTSAIKMYDAAVNRLQAALKASDFDQAMKILDGEVAQQNTTVEAALNEFSSYVQVLSRRNGEDTQSILARNLSMTLQLSAAIAALAIVAVAFVQWLSRRIRRTLDTAVGRMHDFVEQTTAAAAQIAGSSEALADGASQQAAALEETSASLEEMSGMTKRNAEAAQNAKRLAGQARGVVDSGATSMKQMSTAMQGIKTSSGEIAKIIKTIDEIAFQTNILALNAAVEAARAGDAGMGFAVVAEEVRALAQRSAQAARETADKIEAALAKTEEGVRTSGEVASMLDQIVDHVRKMDSLVGEIASASVEQSQGIDQVNRAVFEMDKVTQANAAGAEESAAAARELTSQSNELSTLVGSLTELVGASHLKPTRATVPIEEADESNTEPPTIARASSSATATA
jgi:methyl-accepting chemotaxis protein